MISVGIDPSLTDTGIAISSGVCHHLGRKGLTTLSLAQQFPIVDLLSHTVIETTLEAQPDVVVLEALDMSRASGGLIQRTVLWWEIAKQLDGRGIKVLTVPSGGLKQYATTNGQASKAAVVDAVARTWPEFATAGNDNVADAVVLMAMGAAYLGVPMGYRTEAHKLGLRRLSALTDPPPTKKAKRA